MIFQNVPRVRRCAFWTVVFSFWAYGYRFFSAGFGGDAALVSLSGQAAYQASLGRFLQPVYWLIRGSLVVPSVVGLFTTVFLFLTCWLIANLFGLNQTRDIALLSGLLVTHETLVVSGATYLPWMDVYALSLFFAVLGAYLLMSGGRRAWLSPVFFFLSLGLYQSYLPCAAALMILALARQTLDGKRPGHVFARGCLACLSILAGLLLYALVLAGVLSLTGNNASFAYNGVGSLGSFDFSSIPRYLADTVLTPIRFLFIPDSGAIPSHASSISPYLNWALLLPGRLGPLAGDLEAGWVVSYGLTPRDSLTLSSLGQDGLCLALQREVVTLAGRSLEPQETLLRGFVGVEPELVLAWAGVMLLVGVPVERISRYDFDGSAVDISAADSKQ